MSGSPGRGGRRGASVGRLLSAAPVGRLVAVFGGSFDPIHHGHLLVAQAVAETLGVEELRFVPAREQPFKVGRHGAPAADRAAMVALAIAGEPRFVLDRSELERPGPSYTVDTLRELRARLPDRELVLLLGADAVGDLPLWHQSTEISRLARIVAFARPGGATPDPAAVWRTVAVPAVAISATTIRQRARDGRSLRYWVPDAVAEYIAAHRLYAGSYTDGDG